MAARLRILMLVLASAPMMGCATDRPAGPRAPLHHATAAVAVTVVRGLADLVEVVVWRAPKLLLYELPAWMITEAPGQIALAVAGRRERVEALIDGLDEDDEETRLRSVARLKELTGLPLPDVAAWQAWWAGASGRPEERWRSDFADACLTDLDSDDFLTRQDADERLRALSGRTMGYDPKGSEAERAEGARRWRAWRTTLDGPGGDDR